MQFAKLKPRVLCLRPEGRYRVRARMKMHRVAIVLLAMIVPAVVHGQDEPDSEFEEEFELLQEEQVVYSAAKHAQSISDSPSAITVITGEQIRDSHCSTLACILRMVPEVEVRRVLPMFHAVGARALAGELADKALVLVDGVELNNELFGIVLWAGLPVHLEEIERIEVIRGPGSALYGANAHSLVVSITTKKPERSGMKFYTGAGEHGYVNLFGRADLAREHWTLSLSTGYERADNWRIADMNEGRKLSARAILRHHGPGSESRLDTGLIYADAIVYTGLLPAWWNDLVMFHAALEHVRKPLRGRLTFNMLHGTLSPSMDISYHGIYMGSLPDFPFFNPSVDAEVQFDWKPFDGNLLVAGANYRWIAMYCDNNDPDEEHQHRVGVFIQDEQRLFERLTITGGVRFDYNSITPFTVSPRAALVWHVAENQRLRIAAGRAFRKPSFMNTSFHFTNVEPAPAFPELPGFIRSSIGNRDLGNESITSIETGYRAVWLDNRLELEGDVFFHIYRNTIAFISQIATSPFGLPDLSSSVLRFENEGRDVDTVGGSVALVARPAKGLRLFANYTYRYSWYVSPPEGQSVEGLAGKGSRVPWEPAHLANAGGSWRFENGLGFGIALRYSSARINTQHENGEMFGDQVFIENPAQLVTSGWASWALELDGMEIEAGIKAFNAFDAGFRDTVAVTRPDGSLLGGELIGRRIVFFLRGTL